MVKIRLRRMGTTKKPFYRLVVADSRSPRDGRFIEELGFYDPLSSPAKVQIDAEKVKSWIGKGARPSDSARALLVQQGVLAKQPRVWREAPKKEEPAPAPETAATAPASEGESEAATTSPTASEEADTEEAGNEEKAAEEAQA